MNAPVVETYATARDQGMPVIGHYGYPRRGGGLVMSEFAVFPLSNDGAVIGLGRRRGDV